MGLFFKKGKSEKPKKEHIKRVEPNGITVRVLTVCGSGTVSSTMVATKMEDRFRDMGYHFEATEVNPAGVRPALMSGSYDFIAYTSPIGDGADIPAINAVGFMTGFGEEEFMEQAMEVLRKSGK